MAKPVGKLPSTRRMNLSIVLPLRNQDQISILLNKLYDPSSPDYRRFLTVTEFTDRFGPSAQGYQAVVEFAKSYGFTVNGYPRNRLVVPINGTADQVQRAFHVAMKVYRHPTENRDFFPIDCEPSLDLNVPVAHISGLNNYSLPRSMGPLLRISAAQRCRAPARAARIFQ